MKYDSTTNKVFKLSIQEYNLSRKTFTYNEFKLLHKDLNFCPTPEKYSKTNYDTDIQHFIRKIKLKVHFKATELSNKNDDSKAQLKETHHTVETFIEAINNELRKEEHIKKKLLKPI